MTLEILHRALVLLGGGAGLERAEIAPPAGLRVELARIEAVAAGLKFADHVILLRPPMSSEFVPPPEHVSGRAVVVDHASHSGACGSEGADWRR